MIRGPASMSSQALAATDRVVELPVAGLDDEELLRQLKNSRASAFRELFDRHGRLVRGVLIRMLSAQADVDDLTQETLLVVVRRVDQIRDPAALRSFVYSVAVRVARNELRRRAVRRWIPWADAPHEARTVPPRDAVASEAVQRIYSVLERMSSELRIAFVLRFVEQHDLADGARLAGCSLATFKRRVSRAKARFESVARRDPALVDWFERGRSS